MSTVAERYTQREQEMLQATRRLAKQLEEGAAQRDHERRLPLAESRILREIGIQAARVPVAYGGPGVSFVALSEIMMELAAGDSNLAQMVQPHFTLIEWLAVEGSEAQRRRFFSDVVKGHIITNAIAESTTKTPGHFETSLRRHGDRYRLNGTKYYSTGSLIADQFFILAITEAGSRAVAIVPTTRAGVEIIDDWDGMGQRTTASGTTRLVDVEVDAGEIMPVSTKRNYVGAAAQIVHAAIDVGIAKAALRDAIAYARAQARPVFESGVDRATDDPYVLHLVGEMTVIADSAEALLYRSAEKVDRAGAAHANATKEREAFETLCIEASIAVAGAKAAAQHASLRVSEMMYGVGGASAASRKLNLDRHWRNARTHTSHDPVSYKYKAIGDWLLNTRPPPISTKI